MHLHRVPTGVTWIMDSEAHHLPRQHPTGFDQLPRRRARVVEAHCAAVQAIDQQKG